MREGGPQAVALVVLGYHEYDSEGRHGISAVCAACVRRAEQIALSVRPAVVIFSGWSSTGGPPEAEQMRALWNVGGPELIVEPQARMTSENAAYSLLLLRKRADIERVRVVASIRHRLRVPYLFGPMFRGAGYAIDYDWVAWPLPKPRVWIEELGGLALMRKHRRRAQTLLERS